MPQLPGDETYISVDVETSDPTPGDYSLLSIGACLWVHGHMHLPQEHQVEARGSFAIREDILTSTTSVSLPITWLLCEPEA
jgi:uncharacterized OsmC-like protein